MTADGVMDRVHGSRRDPWRDKYGKISRRCRRYHWEDCHLERARRRQHFNLDQLMSTLTVALASSDEYSDGGSGELIGDDLARFHAERWTRFTSVKRVRRYATFGEIMSDQFCDDDRATYLPCNQIARFGCSGDAISSWNTTHPPPIGNCEVKMVKLTMIARVTDGLPLAERLDDGRDL
ncbi:synaptobrevin family protein [Actinidia rufa]|uniref:Synaptobrevin family protein n=1 Tax=Actinidia rufa TaxID=165716 RepID=A0A7J0GBG6_9ERIC|nr:synaptobrevin family protein [Actinidia rufa]